MQKIILFLLIFQLLSCQQSKEFSHPKNLEKPIVNFYIPNIQLQDSKGTFRDLYQHLDKANILDFWASWCRPCRESANPAYKNLYKKYHSKGLNIYGISSDRHRYFWKKALSQDSLPWINVIDTNHISLKKFQIKSIPKMFLIDNKGKIIGINLWGKELEHKIDSLIKS